MNIPSSFWPSSPIHGNYLHTIFDDEDHADKVIFHIILSSTYYTCALKNRGRYFSRKLNLFLIEILKKVTP